jgi:hypothetical protein
MEKRKQRHERKETGRQQKGGYKRNAKERESGNIQTQNRVYGRGCAIHYAPSSTPIYPSTTYCGNAKKLRTR